MNKKSVLEQCKLELRAIADSMMFVSTSEMIGENEGNVIDMYMKQIKSIVEDLEMLEKEM